MIVSSYFKLGKSLLHDHNYMINWSYFWSKNYHLCKNPVPLSIRYPWFYIHDSFYLQTNQMVPSLWSIALCRLGQAKSQFKLYYKYWKWWNIEFEQHLDYLMIHTLTFKIGSWEPCRASVFVASCVCLRSTVCQFVTLFPQLGHVPWNFPPA